MHSKYLLLKVVSLSLTLAGTGILDAQSAVTTGGGSSGNVPVFTGSSTVANSPITSSGGNVGVGNTSPAYPLDVNGDINLTGQSYRIGGTSVVQFQPSLGNFFLGNSGNQTMTGYQNTGLGNGALGSNAGGTYSIAIGSGSLGSNTNGGLNTAVGVNSLGSNTTGYYNAAVGMGSLGSNTTGEGNAAFGMGTMDSNTSGYENAGFGGGSLQSLVSGFSNTAAGTHALTGLESGQDNVAVGDGAGDDASGQPNTVASSNIYLGASTQSLASGDYNETVIGAYGTGYGNNSITLGNPSVATTVVRGNVLMTNGSSGIGAHITFPDTTVQSTAWNGITLGGDYAESVDVLGDRQSYEPGDVIIIDQTVAGSFSKSNTSYSRLVAGVYSTKPGLTGRRTTAPRPAKDSEIPMAMMGIAPTKVCDENGPVAVGDLLVSSGRPGFAMHGTDRDRLTGAVIGKALQTLDRGSGTIEVLISLQ